jgi:hypothetical protein
MRPGEAFRRLMLERSRICDAAAAAKSIAEQRPTTAQLLHDYANVLRAAMTAYTDLEDEILPDVLQAVDAWGPVRVEHMRAEHGRRRAVLDRALRLIDGRPDDVIELRHALEGLADEVLEELAIEEAEVVCEEVLRDDVTVIDAMTG